MSRTVLRRATVPFAAAGLVLAMTTTVGATPPADAPAKADPHAGAMTEDHDRNDGGTPNNEVDAGDNAHPSGKDRSVEHGGSGNQGRAASDPDDDGRGPDRGTDGPDKPDGAGGVDQADQDGNNGCGNDDDFEDDNEGWCGKRPEQPAPVTPAPALDENESSEGDETPQDAGNTSEGGPTTGALPDSSTDVASATVDRPTTSVRQPSAGLVDVVAARVPDVASPEAVLSNGGAPQAAVLGVSAIAPDMSQAEVLGDVTHRAVAADSATPAARAGALARTGAELLTLAGFGLAAMAAGATARRAGRNRRD